MFAFVVANDSVDVLMFYGQLLMVTSALQGIPGLDELGHLFVEFGMSEWTEGLPALVFVPEDCTIELQVGNKHGMFFLTPDASFSIRRMLRQTFLREGSFREHWRGKLTRFLAF